MIVGGSTLSYYAMTARHVYSPSFTSSMRLPLGDKAIVVMLYLLSIGSVSDLLLQREEIFRSTESCTRAFVAVRGYRSTFAALFPVCGLQIQPSNMEKTYIFSRVDRILSNLTMLLWGRYILVKPIHMEAEQKDGML